jgi:nucleoside-diphosphate-sugar epimerase
MDGQRVLITGAAGRLGQVLMPSLAKHYEVVGLDRRRMPDPTFGHGSIRRPHSLRAAFKGVDVVVHLAADPRWEAPWSSVLRTNIKGTRNVLEAARISGVRRVVFASSNNVTAGYEHDEPWASVVAGSYEGLDPAELPRISTRMPPRPTTPYAVGKLFGEAACRYYSERFQLSTICLRIGSVTPDDRPHTLRHFATLLTHADLVRLVRSAIEAPKDVRFFAGYGVSNNTWRLYDIDEGLSVLDFRPLDDAEEWRSDVEY